MEKKRVVITGMGAVTPIGNSITDYWNGLVSGRSGVKPITHFNTDDFTTKIAATIEDFDPGDNFDKKEVRRTSKFIQYAVVAAQEAITQSGLDINSISESCGVEIGSGMGGIEVLEQASLALNERGPAKVSPFTVPMMIADMASGVVSMKFNAKGPNSCAVTACASAANAIGNASRLIQDGHATAMITGGSEAVVTPLGVASFCAARSLSTQNDSPQTASRPFDLNRDGFVMGEGAGILILEELEHANRRGATILAEVIGFGTSGDAYHLTAPAPEGEGASRAIKMALKLANIDPKDVDYINAHGTSTRLNDKNETAAIKSIFGDHAYSVAISSTKSMTGHLLGAAGAIELIASALAIQHDQVPPTINYETPDPECDLNYTPNTAISRSINIAMSNSLGFGGHNTVLVIKKYN